jgi:biopolymer transport protein ExbD
MSVAVSIGRKARSEINVVPLIDVLLVLLIIFMVTAPLISQRIGLDLPQPVPLDRVPPPPEVDPISLRIDALGQLSVNGTPMSAQAAALLLQVEGNLNPQPELRIDASGDADYRVVAQMLASARDAGIVRIGFVDSD